MNTLESFKTFYNITSEVVSFYMSRDKKEKFDYLPKAHARFGNYNITNLAKDNEIYFWTSTSTKKWTLDLVQVQYGDEIYDIERNSQVSDDTHLYTIASWQVDHNDEEFVPKIEKTMKAIINPSSPFIALPQNLFSLI